jgi:hypothetical protein
MSYSRCIRCLKRSLLLGVGGATVMLMSAIAAEAADGAAQDNVAFVSLFEESAFHEIETKYIFGSFTIGSSTGIEGERAIEPDTQADFGKRGGRYAATQTELELEYTPNQFVEIEFGPTISYYNIGGVPGMEDRNSGNINGVVATIRSLLIERGKSPFAVTLSIEPEWRSIDETTGESVSNYELEAKIEADAELIKNRLFLCFNVLYEPETTSVNAMPAAWNTKRRSASHRRLPCRLSLMSWSAPTSGICATMMVWRSTHSPATPFIWAQHSSGK